MSKLRNLGVKGWKGAFFIATIIYVFIAISKISAFKQIDLDINNILLDVFSNINLESNNMMFNYSSYIINYVIISYVYGNYISEDLKKNSIYIFTRTADKNKWVNKKVLDLFFFVSIYVVLEISVSLIVLFASGFRIINIYNFIIVLFSIMLNLIVNFIIVILIANIVSIKFSDIIGYTISLIIFSLSILLTYILNMLMISGEYYRYIPFVNSITSWYSVFNNIVNRNINNISFFMGNHSFIICILIAGVVIFILQVAIRKIINNMDIL